MVCPVGMTFVCFSYWISHFYSIYRINCVFLSTLVGIRSAHCIDFVFTFNLCFFRLYLRLSRHFMCESSPENLQWNVQYWSTVRWKKNHNLFVQFIRSPFGFPLNRKWKYLLKTKRKIFWWTPVWTWHIKNYQSDWCDKTHTHNAHSHSRTSRKIYDEKQQWKKPPSFG